MANAFVQTRLQLHGIAESLIAGPQYRSAGTVKLSVRPDGFTGVAVPIAVEGGELVWEHGHRALFGSLESLADEAGLDAGPPIGSYNSDDPLPLDTVLDIDDDSATLLYRSLNAGDLALRTFATDSVPVLWPEHFDVASTVGEVNYGVSAGDSYHARPYAYVGPWTPRTGSFWNAPFGALLTLDDAADVAGLTTAVTDFFVRGRGHL